MKMLYFVFLVCILHAADLANSASLEDIQKIARSSDCAKYNWKNRGLAPKAYMEGVALTFARAVCQPDRDDVKVVSQARGKPEAKADLKDSLSWYNSNFRDLGMFNDKSGTDTLRHAYTLLIGLGMRESSGKHCCGRDMSANFSSAGTAEAGIFQTSWGSRITSSVLEPMFKRYQSAPSSACFLEVFSKGVTCSGSNWKNWARMQPAKDKNGKEVKDDDGKPVMVMVPSELPGYTWQGITKKCPAFATEWAAVLLRSNGGTKGEFGPLRRKEAQIRPECDRMLSQVETLTLSDPEYCRLLVR